MSLALVVLVFLLTAFLVVGVGSVVLYRREQVKGRLESIKKMSADADPEDILRLPFVHRVVFPFLSGIGHTLGNIAPREIRSKVEKRIMYAGNPRNLNFYSLLALQVLVGGAFFLATMFFLRLAGIDAFRITLVTLFFAAAGFYLPYGIIRNKGDARMHEIRKSLPDFLDLLLVSVEAGLGFDMALNRVSRQMPGPISVEVKRALEEIRMGGSRETAFRGIAWRSGVSEVSSFISAVIQAEQLGSNITSTLRVQAEYMRLKRRQRAEEMAQKAPVKMVFPMVFFIFPALFIVILGPAVISIYQMLLGL